MSIDKKADWENAGEITEAHKSHEILKQRKSKT